MRQREIVRWYCKGYKKGESERKKLRGTLKNVVHQLMKEKPKSLGFLLYQLGVIQGKLGEDKIFTI